MDNSSADGGFSSDERCTNCGRTLTRDEIGCYKKMINRGAREFMCLMCLADYLGCTEDMLRERIEHFKAQGCMLFR